MTETLLPLLEGYYQSAFPERPGARIRDLRALRKGWESDVYAFTADWGSGEREAQALRIYPGVDGYEKSYKEYHALRKLHAAGYPVPRVDNLAREESPFGRPFLIIEYIQGQDLWQIMFRGAQAEQVAWRAVFCRLFASLHRLDWRPFVADPAGIDALTGQQILRRQIDQWKQIIESVQGQMPGFNRAFQWLEAHVADVPGGRPAVLHWDFHPENILRRAADGQEYVIDWTGLEVSDPRFDLAWTLLLITCVEGAHLREPFLREYERQAGSTVEGIEFFDAAACLRRLYSVIASLALGPEQLGMRPEAVEAMRGQASRLRFVYELLLTRTGVTIPEVEAFLNEMKV